MNLTDLYDAILNGKLDRAVAVTNEAISEGVLPNEIITNYMIKAMEEIGNRFEAGKVFVPNLLMSARAMKGALDLLKPLLQGETDAYVGKIVIGTVKGDLHDIGKNLVASMFEGCRSCPYKQCRYHMYVFTADYYYELYEGSSR